MQCTGLHIELQKKVNVLFMALMRSCNHTAVKAVHRKLGCGLSATEKCFTQGMHTIQHGDLSDGCLIRSLALLWSLAIAAAS